VRIDGPKWMLDGTPVEQNALQREPYPGRPDWRGRSNYTDGQLREILQSALRRPEQMALHVVGTAETDRVFAMMESLATASAWRDKRVRIEHGDGIRPDTLAQAVRLGVVVIQNPTHFPPAGTPRSATDPHSMLRSLLAAGVPIALGSDGGPEEANPFLNIMLASTYAASPSEALSREQALLAYTAGAAFVERQERSKGQIKKGMAADLALLSQDILTVALPALPATRSVLTLVDGEIVVEDPAMTGEDAPK
jgi:predicted amidohydrolase YtcJ